MEAVKTLHLSIDPNSLQAPAAGQTLDIAAAILRRGGLVAIPTETVYGLAANALDADAVASIFTAKQRPAWDPVIVHIAHQDMLAPLVAHIPPAAPKLMQAFWPGPLTLLLPRSSAVPGIVTAGRQLVGIRMPAHPVALELIRRAGVPVAAPSANRFGHISPTTAAHVLADLDGRIDAILDAGPTHHGLESTVLDPTQSPMLIYRAVAGPVEIFRPDAPLADVPNESLPSPGVGIRHYAPIARLTLVDAPLAILGERIVETVRSLAGERVGVLLPAGLELPELPGKTVVRVWGRWDAPDTMARELYAALRDLDAQNCASIVCPVPPAEGVGAAIRDRLRKAAR